MGYCWKCGTKLEEGMAYCPKCGVSTNQQPQRTYNYEDKTLQTVGLAVVGVLVAVIIIVVALGIAGLLPVQSPFGNIGSGRAQTTDYNITDFTAISASRGFNVQITQGSTYSVKVTIDDNLVQYLNVHKEGSTLIIETQPGISYQTAIQKAEVTIPQIQNIQLSGGSVADAKNFNQSENLTVDLSGGSRITMTGQGGDLTVMSSGGSNTDLRDFQVNDANIDMSGGSQCRINLSGRLDASLSGGSQLHYRGNPTMGTIDTSGGSSISPDA